MSFSPQHAKNVRFLYKSCLRLHRGLPQHLKILGDAYLRDEFKRHKDANEAQTHVFMEAWAKYALDLSKQMAVKGISSQNFGQSLEAPDLDHFTDEQLAQLYDLYQESSKPQQ